MLIAIDFEYFLMINSKYLQNRKMLLDKIDQEVSSHFESPQQFYCMTVVNESSSLKELHSSFCFRKSVLSVDTKSRGVQNVQPFLTSLHKFLIAREANSHCTECLGHL